MANIKILKHAKAEGYCCLWAFLEANRGVYTSELMTQLEGVCKLRALQTQRRAHRKGETECEGLKNCLKGVTRKKT